MLDISTIQTQIAPLCKRHDILWLGLFGSFARGEDTDESDMDFLVEFSRRKSLLALIRLKNELNEVLGRQVDLVTRNALSPYLKDRILLEMKVIYEA